MPPLQRATDRQFGDGLFHTVHSVAHSVIHRAVDVTLLKWAMVVRLRIHRAIPGIPIPCVTWQDDDAAGLMSTPDGLHNHIRQDGRINLTGLQNPGPW